MRVLLLLLLAAAALLAEGLGADETVLDVDASQQVAEAPAADEHDDLPPAAPHGEDM